MSGLRMVDHYGHKNIAKDTNIFLHSSSLNDEMFDLSMLSGSWYLEKEGENPLFKGGA